MKLINDEKYLTIGEVAKRIDRTTITIKNWYTWLDEQPDDVKAHHVLPEPVTLDLKGTRYYRESDVPLFLVFRNRITYGKMADTNYRNWGKRGKHIHAKKKH